MEGTRLSELDPKRNEKAWGEIEAAAGDEWRGGRQKIIVGIRLLAVGGREEEEGDKGSLEAQLPAGVETTPHCRAFIWGQRLMRGAHNGGRQEVHEP